MRKTAASHLSPSGAVSGCGILLCNRQVPQDGVHLLTSKASWVEATRDTDLCEAFFILG
jgi:hypothetical protein